MRQQNKESCKKIMYVDQIMKGNNKQDVLTVFTFIEGIITSLITNAPFNLAKRTLAIVSDNAGCYVSKILIIGIQLLNVKCHDKIFITKLGHSETQDGKGLVDSHFAIAMRHLLHFMKCVSVNKIHQIRTPEGLAFALAWGNGVHNSLVQLIEVNRLHTERLASFFKHYFSEMLRFIGRASEIQFIKPTPNQINIFCNADFQSYDTLKEQLARFDFPSRPVHILVLEIKSCLH